MMPIKSFNETRRLCGDQNKGDYRNRRMPVFGDCRALCDEKSGEKTPNPAARNDRIGDGIKRDIEPWVSENYRSKKTHDITTNSVTISTIHSVKGLDYSAVFLLGLDFLEPHNWTVEQIERLIYVAITRARYQLFIPYMVENQFIAKLKACLSYQ